MTKTRAGVAVAALSLLCTLGFVLAADATVPVAGAAAPDPLAQLFD